MRLIESSWKRRLVVDEGRVSRLLRGITDRVTRLRAAALSDGTGDLWLDGVKYLFITTIEGCVDVAHHLCSSEQWATPDSNSGAIRELHAHGVIDAPTAEAITRAVGFRNVLVHQYTEVDDDIVLAALGRLDELTGFVTQVSRWVLSQQG
jgi:uncharacterized protein YutE (UPF0331/DUF86 family)